MAKAFNGEQKFKIAVYGTVFATLPKLFIEDTSWFLLELLITFVFADLFLHRALCKDRFKPLRGFIGGYLLPFGVMIFNYLLALLAAIAIYLSQALSFQENFFIELLIAYVPEQVLGYFWSSLVERQPLFLISGTANLALTFGIFIYFRKSKSR